MKPFVATCWCVALVIGCAFDTRAHRTSAHTVRYLFDSTYPLHRARRLLVEGDAAPLRNRASRPQPARMAPDDELLWIDRAQRALVLRPAVARAIIDAYRAAVSPRTYDEEATALAAEASARMGDRDRATREALAFERAFPGSAYEDRVRAVEREESP